MKAALGGAAFALLVFAVTESHANEKWVAPNTVYLADSFGMAQTCQLFDGSPMKRSVVAGDALYVSYAVSDAAPVGEYRFRLVAVSTAGTQSIHERILNPRTMDGDIGWQNVRVPLNRYAGQDVEIQFSVNYSSPSAKIRRPAKKGEAYWGGVRIGNFARKPGQKNVILISIDTLRADRLGCYGYWRDTSPNIDDIAADGVRFDEAISQASWTKPSHASIFTGLYPATHRVIGAGFSSHHVITDPTITEALQQNGFVTHAVTSAGFLRSYFGFYKGFDQYQEKQLAIGSGPGVGRLMDEARKFLDQSHDDRFFLFFHTYEIHTPRRHVHFGKSLQARYDSSIRFTDSYIGDFMVALKELGLSDNTLIILTSDHGEDLGAHYSNGTHGHSMYDELLRVPLIFWCPSLFPPAVVKNFQAKSIDIFPSILEILGYSVPSTLQGASLLPYLNGKQPPTRSIAMSEGVLRGPEQKSVRLLDGEKRYKLVVAPRVAMPDSDLALRTESVQTSMDSLGRRAAKHVRDESGLEFFDLQTDPLEQKNLASTKPPMMKKMLNMLVDRMSSVPVPGKESPDTSKELDPDAAEDLRALGY